MIETAVAEHHDLDRGRIEVEPLEVVVNRRDRIGAAFFWSALQRYWSDAEGGLPVSVPVVGALSG